MNTQYDLISSKMFGFRATPVVFSGDLQRSVGLPIRSPLPWHPLISSTPSSNRKEFLCLKDRRTFTTNTKAIEKSMESEDVIEFVDDPNIVWWIENMQSCRKTSSTELISRLSYSNLLGLDCNLINESTKQGKLFTKLLEFKSRFPQEVFLHRVGNFYEAIGFDACMLEEHTVFNPLGGMHSDSFPKVGFHFENLYQTLDDLTCKGFTVCIVEEVPLPAGYVSHCMDGRIRGRLFHDTYLHLSHVKPEGCHYISHDDNPRACKESMEEFQKHVENVVWEICHKLLNMLLDELWGGSKPPEEEEYAPRCDFISPHCNAPFKTAGRSSVYLMLTPKQELYIGETDDLYVWTYILRSKKGMKNSSFLYFLVPNMKVAIKMTILLINTLPEYGLTCKLAVTIETLLSGL